MTINIFHLIIPLIVVLVSLFIVVLFVPPFPSYNTKPSSTPKQVPASSDIDFNSTNTIHIVILDRYYSHKNTRTVIYYSYDLNKLRNKIRREYPKLLEIHDTLWMVDDVRYPNSIRIYSCESHLVHQDYKNQLLSGKVEFV